MHSEAGRDGGAAYPPVAAEAIRVVSWNLWHDPTERIERAAVVGRTLAALDASIVAVQELEHAALETVVATICAHAPLQVVAVSGGSGEHTVTAVLSALPGVAEDPIACTTAAVPLPYHAAVAAIDTPGGGRVRVCAAHLAWGGVNEWARLEQARGLHRELDARCGNGGTDGCILAGDFNALPESATLRYLTGLDVHHATCAQWTDAWSVCGDGPGWTSVPENPWARETAVSFGFHRPDLLPRRRIDYVLVHGYAYGRLYTPVQSFTVDGTETGAAFPGSDHAAVVVDLYDPVR